MCCPELGANWQLHQVGPCAWSKLDPEVIHLDTLRDTDG